MPHLADLSYLAVKPEITPGIAVRPDRFIRIISETIKSVLAHTPDRELKGRIWKSDDILRGARTHEGDLTVWAGSESLGHLLNMILRKGTTTGSAADGWVHPFEVGDGKSYTIEIGKGAYAQRYVGVRGGSLRLEFADQKLQAILSVGAMIQHSITNLATALTATSTAVKLTTDYDMRPADGLVTGDIVQIQLDVGGYMDVTVGTIDTDGQGFAIIATAGLVAAMGNRVRLKLQTPTFPAFVEPFYQGNALVGIGVSEATATIAAGAKSTATPIYDMALNFLCNLFFAPATGGIDPISVLPQTRECNLTISQMFVNEIQYQRWLNRVKQAITLIARGRPIGVGRERLTWRFHNVKLIENEQAIEVGTYIFDRQTFESLHDAVDGRAIGVELVNRTIATDY